MKKILHAAGNGLIRKLKKLLKGLQDKDNLSKVMLILFTLCVILKGLGVQLVYVGIVSFSRVSILYAQLLHVRYM